MSEKSGQQGGGPTVRRGGWRSLGQTAGGVAKKALGRHGRAQAALFTDWVSVVGPEIAENALPVKISFPKRDRRAGGTLHLRVASAGYATQLQHLEPVIVERINAYFGYGAVARLAFRHGPLPKRAEAPEKPVPERRGDPAPAPEIEGVASPELRQALQRLGAAMRRRGPG